VSERDGFIRAIINSPDDDVPRLAFADFLDEHGQRERAEFVRCQCRIAALTDDRTRDDCQCPRCLEIAALRRRERELLDANFSRWSEPVWSLVRRGNPGIAFSRGFVSRVTLDWESWREHGGVILESCPIRQVNRPRECVRCQGGGYVWHSDDTADGCPACRGTGRVDDWRGDGLVRLTTWPEPPWQVVTDEASRAGLLAQLAAKWRGVPFELPRAEDSPDQPTHEQFTEVSRRVADGLRRAGV
jgi:uncharacterized protein (TIGR02996 family)